MAGLQLNTKPQKPKKKEIKLTVATAETREVKPEGPLFYILPPLVVGLVFLYCAVGTPHWLPEPAPAVAAPLAPDENMSEEEAEFFSTEGGQHE